MDDAHFLLRIRNDRETRRQSVQHGRVTKVQHHRWLKKTLSDPDSLLFTVEAGCYLIGSARLDGKIRLCEVSLAIDRLYRGDGFMAPLIEALKAEGKKRGYRRMQAQVRQSNPRSLRGFLRAGFVPTGDELMTLEADL